MTKTRKQYSKEFKLDAISLVLDQGYTRREAAASLEINAQMLGRWIKESKEEDGQAFRGKGRLTPDQEEIKRLKEENRRLQMERDILKNPPPGSPRTCRQRNSWRSTLRMYPRVEAVRLLVALTPLKNMAQGQFADLRVVTPLGDPD